MNTVDDDLTAIAEQAGITLEELRELLYRLYLANGGDKQHD